MPTKRSAASTEETLLSRLEGLKKMFANNSGKLSTVDLRDALPLIEAVINNEKDLRQRLERVEAQMKEQALPGLPAGIRALTKPA